MTKTQAGINLAVECLDVLGYSVGDSRGELRTDQANIIESALTLAVSAGKHYPGVITMALGVLDEVREARLSKEELKAFKRVNSIARKLEEKYGL